MQKLRITLNTAQLIVGAELGKEQTSINFCNAWGRVVSNQNHLPNFCLKYANLIKLEGFQVSITLKKMNICKSTKTLLKEKIYILFLQNPLPILKSPGDKVPASLKKMKVWQGIISPTYEWVAKLPFCGYILKYTDRKVSHKTDSQLDVHFILYSQ